MRESRRSIGFGTTQVGALALAGVLGLSALSGAQRAMSRHAAQAAAPAAPVDEGPVLGMGLGAEPDDAQGAVAAAAGWDLPNLDHPRVDEFIRMFSGSQRGEFSRYLTRMGHYQPMISAKLAERGMPQDLIYLAMIESGFSPTAYSRAHASGMWQFIAETGRRYGLEQNLAVDMRNDPERATDAALTYLQTLYDRFGSWYLAAAAYNTGENRVGRIMRQVTGSERGDEYSYYRIRSRLPKETRDYVPLMVAAARIAKDPEQYGFADVEPGAPLVFDRVTVPPATPLARIAEAAGTTVAEVRRLNPQLKLQRTRNDKPDEIRIPAGSRVAFDANWPRVRDMVVASASAPVARTAPAARTYRIRKGDNLIRIAQRHGTTVAAIKRANNLRGDRIRAGSTLRIPVSS